MKLFSILVYRSNKNIEKIHTPCKTRKGEARDLTDGMGWDGMRWNRFVATHTKYWDPTQSRGTAKGGHLTHSRRPPARRSCPPKAYVNLNKRAKAVASTERQRETVRRAKNTFHSLTALRRRHGTGASTAQRDISRATSRGGNNSSEFRKLGKIGGGAAHTIQSSHALNQQSTNGDRRGVLQ